MTFVARGWEWRRPTEGPDAAPEELRARKGAAPALTCSFRAGTLDGAAYRRTGRAWHWSSTACLETLPPDAPRFDFDPRTGELLGLLHETAVTNHLSWGRRLREGLSAGVWASDGILVADDTRGLDGRANRATCLTADTAHATALAYLRLPLAEYTFSAWVRRRRGCGRVDITLDGGTRWQEVTAYLLGGRWDRVGTHMLGPGLPALCDPVVGFRITEPGDAIEVDLCQVEAGGFATSEIPTEGVTMSRMADALTLGAGYAVRWPLDAALCESRHLRGVVIDGSTVVIGWYDGVTRTERVSKLFDEVA